MAVANKKASSSKDDTASTKDKPKADTSPKTNEVKQRYQQSLVKMKSLNN